MAEGAQGINADLAPVAARACTFFSVRPHPRRLQAGLWKTSFVTLTAGQRRRCIRSLVTHSDQRPAQRGRANDPGRHPSLFPGPTFCPKVPGMTIHRARILQRFAFSKRMPGTVCGGWRAIEPRVQMGKSARVKRANIRRVFDFLDGTVIADLLKEIEVSITD